jgi:predicted amidohydrolase YtcJ
MIMNRSFFTAAVWSLICFLSACQASTEAPEPLNTVAEAVYYNGSILTMNDKQAQVEALAVSDGKIAGAGSLAAMKALSDASTRWVDLDGKALLPGFFDSHSHVVLTAAKLAVVNTDPPPAGPADSIDSIRRVLSERLQSAPPLEGEWLVGWGYDNAMLAEQRHPTRDDLDLVSKDVPVALIHFSTHQVVVNSAGLAAVGISEHSEDPKGGRIERFPGSNTPNGILQENAMYPVVFPILDQLISGGADIAKGSPPGEGALARLDHALKQYAAQGFTTVTEMGATPPSLALLNEMARQQRFPLDVVAYGLSKVFNPEQVAAIATQNYQNRFRVGGTKIVLDGGSPGRSAYLREPYHRQMAGEAAYRGYSQIDDQATLNDLVTANYEAGNSVVIHALGDAAVDQAIEAISNAEKQSPIESPKERRTQLIHVQQAQEDQLAALAELDVTLTFQVAHNFYFGDFHEREIYGPERTARLNPARSALEKGLSVTIHHDSPVHPVDQMLLIWAAVNRTTRSGKTIGAEQQISVMDALKASTINAAYQFGEEDSKGSLEAGKLADMVILSENPLTVEPQRLKDIRVLETIKEGVSIYRVAP